ncbi:methylamine utilization protein [Marinobacter sp.]|uniref:methylamine utilization protein n=1 Tax=Marinobacter sp. TaxID=50741 RepID=UPI0038506E75
MLPKLWPDQTLIYCGLFLLICGTARAGVVELTFTEAANARPLANVIVQVGGTAGVVPDRAVMSQKNRAFDPHILTVVRGSEVSFPNNDNTQHHVYSFSSTKPFNIELYAGHPETPVVFDRTGIVELGCNIHDHMQAFILVADTPHVARSGADGRVRLDVPDRMLSGSGLEIRLWHPRLQDNTISEVRHLPGSWPVQQSLTLELAPEQADSMGLGGLQKRFQEL